ncbi:MAG TPA: hypothetical protein VGF95_11200 [Solirubrobacteraceae bacterium]|jgi:hypothetical protein
MSNTPSASSVHVLDTLHLYSASAYSSVGFKIVLAIHIMAVVIAFGATFAYPLFFAIGSRQEPRSLPLLHRLEYNFERWVLNPALVLVLGAGIYLASDAHLWKEFFVQWGFAAVIVIGGLAGAVMIPTSKRAEALSRRDIEASGADSAVTFSAEYRALVRRLAIVGGSLSTLVLVTIFFMAYKL